MKVADIMTSKLYCLSKNNSIQEAAQLFIDQNIDGAPVTDENGFIIGLVGKSNLYRAIAKGLEWAQPVETIMVKDVVTIDINDDTEELINLPYGRLPVLSEGKLAGIVTQTDIVKVYNQSLQDLTSGLQTLMDSVHNAIVSIDCDKNIKTFNLAAQKLFGYSQDPIIGKPYKDYFPSGNLTKVMREGKILTGQKVAFNNLNLICNYAPIIVEDKIVGAVSVSQDISELENVTNQLRNVRELNDEMQAVIEASFDSFFVTDAAGKVLSVNEAYTRITGITSEEILGKTMYELVEDGYYDRSATIEVLKTGKTVTFTQNIKNGRTMLVTGNPIFDKKGELVRVLTNGRDITELNRLKHEVEQAQELSMHFQRELRKYKDPEGYVVKSEKLRNVFDLVHRLGRVDSTILVQGESGVGKEIIANELHRSSIRSEKPMVKVNCAAIPENLLESELFGYEPGAFTGARKEGKMGIFELAHTGTLFLDEIGELPIGLQVKLLRVIQENEVTRIGGTKPIKIDVRLITASNRDLWDMVEKKQFRKDLFYRLNVVPIMVPPLRERREEVPALINHFTGLFNEKYGLNRKIDDKLVASLINYDWPGNIRELRNLVERAIVTSSVDLIKDIRLDEEKILGDSDSQSTMITVQLANSLKGTLDNLEKEILAKSINEYGSSRKVASALGLSQTSVVRKAARYGLALLG